MQSILYHNSSGNMAFTGNLKKKEVHQAITMHPVKDHKHMFRINTYLKNLKIQDLKEMGISLHRDIVTAAKELNVSPNIIDSYYISRNVPLFPNGRGHSDFLGDSRILGVAPSLNRYHPTDVQSVLSWNFLTKMVFSPDNANPRRRMEISTVESLEDIIREVMETINGYSKQRGRVIEFREILYGYQRLDPIHGADYILDILLVYKKYRGRKMTVSVRRHAYLQQTFTGIEIRELPFGEPSPEEKLTQNTDYNVDHVYQMEELPGSPNNIPFIYFKKLNVPIRDAFQTGIMKLSESLPNVFKHQEIEEPVKIYFILPLSGRYDTFVRFMMNYEQVCLISDKRTSIIISLYNDKRYPEDFQKTINLIDTFKQKYPYSEILLIKIDDMQFSRGLSLQKGIESCKNDDLLFIIDVDIIFNAESLQRIRLNTVKHQIVYFPIVFSEYNPSVIYNDEYNTVKIRSKYMTFVTNNLAFNTFPSGSEFVYRGDHEDSDDYGYFRQFGFGIASVYKADLVSVGGFNTDIKGWGLEDVHLFDKFVQSNVSIFRAVDSGLVHVYHPVDCDKNLDIAQYNMCVGTRTNTFGSTKHMTVYILNHPNVLSGGKTDIFSDKSKYVPR